MTDRAEAIANAERALAEIEVARAEIGGADDAPESQGSFAIEPMDTHLGGEHVGATRRRRRSTTPSSPKQLLIAAAPLGIAIIACFVVMIAANSDSVRTGAGIVGIVLLLLLGVVGTIVFARAEGVSTKDLDVILKDAEAAIKELLGLVKAPGTGGGSGGVGDPAGGSTPKPGNAEEDPVRLAESTRTTRPT
jgi:hypothetical protein